MKCLKIRHKIRQIRRIKREIRPEIRPEITREDQVLRPGPVLRLRLRRQASHVGHTYIVRHRGSNGKGGDGTGLACRGQGGRLAWSR